MHYAGSNRTPKCHIINTIEEDVIYIADYTKKNNGKVKVCGSQLTDIEVVTLDNKAKKIKLHYDAFLPGAFKKNNSQTLQQCECVIFPCSMNEDDWILFVETKYTTKEYSDPTFPLVKAICQIGETALLFKKREVISNTKEVTGIIAFPELMSPFSDMLWLIDNATEKRTVYALSNIFFEISNTATIHSATELEITK